MSFFEIRGYVRGRGYYRFRGFFGEGRVLMSVIMVDDFVGILVISYVCCYFKVSFRLFSSVVFGVGFLYGFVCLGFVGL